MFSLKLGLLIIWLVHHLDVKFTLHSFLIFFLICSQGKSLTSATGKAADGALPARTNWPATTGNTREPDLSSAANATAASAAPTISPSTWSGTRELTSRSLLPLKRACPAGLQAELFPPHRADDFPLRLLLCSVVVFLCRISCFLGLKTVLKGQSWDSAVWTCANYEVGPAWTDESQTQPGYVGISPHIEFLPFRTVSSWGLPINSGGISPSEEMVWRITIQRY